MSALEIIHFSAKWMIAMNACSSFLALVKLSQVCFEFPKRKGKRCKSWQCSSHELKCHGGHLGLYENTGLLFRCERVVCV